MARLQPHLLLPGAVCLLVGIGLPTSNLYHQFLAILLWIPGLAMLWTCRSELRQLLRSALGVSLLAFTAWSLATLFWSSVDDPFRQFKHVLYVVLSLWAMRLLGTLPQFPLERMLRFAAYFMAGLAGVYLLKTYWLEGAAWTARVTGVWQLEHSILAAQAFGFFMVVLYNLKPDGARETGVWAVALAVLLAYLVFAQSKGIWIALAAVLVLAPLWKRERLYTVLSAGCLLGGGAALWLAPEFALQRGLSYRPELAEEGLKLLLGGNPFLGLGMGSSFQLQIEAIAAPFDHPHNLLLDIALQLGLVGLVLWVGAWLLVGWLAWRMWDVPLGSALLGAWLFASLAVLSDGAGLWSKPQEIWFLTWIPIGLALALERLQAWRRQPLDHSPP
ncbi:O-antigen ligase family protein [Zestomonas carbonaria]|uniref:O-antigen ligase-related domain-containing protein n=1 Tax=Zestomonas carbonaria TaxID=2762745 RepID=A0A7U7EL76_9GAMM|nr:O-antigen ligase family protein [Pseudomonas carbonaria]CAD5107048.1 hypothetical protein PSEWESI4_01319 [Pseudomonas carbonaria]